MDQDLIQVKAPKAELQRRIAAFTSRKRAELDRANCLEFRGAGGAARVAALLVRSQGSTGHLRRSRAVDGGPPLAEAPAVKLEPGVQPPLPDPLENRISELEERVFFREQEPVPVAVYQRLRELEARVEELVGLSPDHCRPVEVVRARDRAQAAARGRAARRTVLAGDLKNIDTRILELRGALRTKIDAA
jgi:hypothetical protein